MELLRFTDSDGREWEVWEVTGRPVYADRAQHPWVPGGAFAESARLHFESATQSRLLTRYPAWWHAMEDRDLAELCAAAHLEPPPGVRRIAVALAGLR